ncbi:MAG TPA: hypothetical protein VHK01_14055 [Lacipirellulaceae bacterium]|jgi:hypothetical protein|nr:hypothetical protein [Lacipirellulaceae bacterium]
MLISFVLTSLSHVVFVANQFATRRLRRRELRDAMRARVKWKRSLAVPLANDGPIHSEAMDNGG